LTRESRSVELTHHKTSPVNLAEKIVPASARVPLAGASTRASARGGEREQTAASPQANDVSSEPDLRAGAALRGSLVDSGVSRKLAACEAAGSCDLGAVHAGVDPEALSVEDI